MKQFISLLFLLVFVGCKNDSEKNRSDRAVYVQPSITRNGRFRKGYVRMPVSTSKNAVKHQAKSRYYYKTRGKYNKRTRY